MRKRIVRTLVLLGAIVGVAMLVLESSMRFYPEARPSHAQQRIETLYTGDGTPAGRSVPDDWLGFLGKPLQRECIETIDFAYTKVTDEFGFANAGPWPDQVDIVFLGDSLLSGAGVGIDRQFTTVVGNQLPESSVINLSLPGASPEHQLRIFRRFATELNPRIVIACLYVASDIDNAKHFDLWERTGRKWSYEEFRTKHYVDTLAVMNGREDRETYGIDAGKAGIKTDPGWRKALRAAVNSMVIGKELVYFLDPWRKGVLHDVRSSDGSRVYLYRRFQQRLAKGIGDDYPMITGIFFDPLIELRAAVESAGGVFQVVLIPSKEEIFRADSNIDALRLVEEVRQTLEDLEMPVLDLYPVIDDVAQTTAPFFPHDIHLNAAGNAAAADAIVDWLNRSGKL
jgi:hypothetical protein